jgi:hypothetical protein
MGSEIERGGRMTRPCFNYNDSNGIESIKMQMLESVRNVLEDVRTELKLLNQKQMLQCDVRRDVREMRIALQKLAKGKRLRAPRKTRA